MTPTTLIQDEWKNVELSSILDFAKKSKHKAADGKNFGKYKFYSSSNIQSKFIDEYDYEGEYIIFGTGGTASLHYCNDKFTTTADCLVATISDSSISKKFVYYYLKANIHLLEAGFRGAGLKHISKSYISKIKIFYPSNKKIQEKIVAILEKAEQLKQWRQESDRFTNDYLNSVFLEMFGDFTHWKTERLDVLIEEDSHISYGIVQPGDEFYMGIPVIRPVDIIENRLNYDKIKKVDPKIEERYKRTRLQGNEILITVRGTTGNTVITDNRCNGFNVTRGIALIRPNVKKINIEYLNEFLKSHLGSKYIQEHTKGATLRQINIKDLKAMPIAKPPRDLQDSFAKAIKNVNQMKAYQKSSEKQINNLFNTLMQKAFRGELIQ